MSGNAEPYGREGLPLEEARRRVLAALKPITASNTVPLQQALGRVSTADVLASAAVPGFRASIMDGYALGQSHQPKPGDTWQLKGRSAAGQPFNRTLASGGASLQLPGVPRFGLVALPQGVAVHDRSPKSRNGRAGQHIRSAHPAEGLLQRHCVAGCDRLKRRQNPSTCLFQR